MKPPLEPQFPLKCEHYISQKFGEQSSVYTSGFHLGLDIVPTENGAFFPAPVYAILDGTLRYFYETQPTTQGITNSKAIAVDTWLDDDFITYLKGLGKVPPQLNKVRLMHSYLHGLEILDKDGTIDQITPIMKCGNTGMVFSGGVPVPEEEKGVPPYKGGHLHLQCELYREDNILIGFIDPEIILGYNQGELMTNSQFVHKQGTSEYGFFLPATTEDSLKDKALNLGLEIANPDGTVNFGLAKEISGL